MKYYLSLCCVIKNERYIKEFLIYYIIQGVEHFYLYDNESKKSLKKVLKEPIFQKCCTTIDYPGKCIHMPIYNECIQKTKDITKWLIIVDADEFILPKKKFTVREFLNDYEDYQAIGINWVMFGSNGHIDKQNGLLIENYVKCEDYESVKYKHIKTICQPKYVKNIDNPHYVKTIDPTKFVDPDKNIIKGAFNPNGRINLIQINHYWGKSLEEYKKKIKNGRPDQVEKNKYLEGYMKMYNNKKDKTIKKKYSTIIRKICSENDIHIE